MSSGVGINDTTPYSSVNLLLL